MTAYDSKEAIGVYTSIEYVEMDTLQEGNVCYGNQPAVKTRANYDKKSRLNLPKKLHMQMI